MIIGRKFASSAGALVLALSVPFVAGNRAFTSSSTSASSQFGSVRSTNPRSSVLRSTSVNEDANYAGLLNGRLQRWNHFPLTVAFVKDGNLTPDRERLALAGFDNWVSATGSRVSYRLVASPSAADVTVKFNPDLPYGVTNTTFRSNVLSHAAVSVGIAPADGHPLSNEDVKALAAHEFGHALGINGHSADPNDLMYPSIDGNNKVTARDANTLAVDYHFSGTAGV
ncbi:MAG: matrixin family metalloprotease [Chloroflexi bacterium]|nr:matrixin family metalloprotease [Chloroflexota bacterium]